MMKDTVLRVLMVGVVMCAMGGRAAPELARVFADHMVLQRGESVPVFGTDAPGQSVTVTFAGQTKNATTDGSGNWRVDLDPMVASMTGRALTVTGSSVISISDVLVGEVWLAAGQSNMDWRVNQSSSAPHPENYGRIRMCNWTPTVGTGSGTVYGPAEFANLTPDNFYAGTWQQLDATAVQTQSGVAYFFANALARERVDVPIGIVELAIGGTSTEAFIPVAALQADSFLNAGFEDPRGVRTLGQWISGRISKNLTGYVHTDPAEPHPHPYAPGFLYWTGMEHIVPFAFKGAIWYQGESNAEFTEAPYNWNGDRISDYQTDVMTTLVDAWRAAFDKPDFPIYMVQLPRISGATRTQWPWYREAQIRVAQQRAGVELAVVTEFGVNGSNVHPANKEPVGERLAYIARNQLYGESIPYSGPAYASHQIVGNKIILHFDHVEDGLISGDGAPLRHFQIAGEGRTFVPATATIVGDTIEVSAASVAAPVAVRYGWEMNIDVNFYNTNSVENLPASPFRTDDWATSSSHIKLFVLTGQSNSLGTTNGGESDPSSGSDPADAHVQFFWDNIAGEGVTIGSSGGVFTTLQDQQGGYYGGSATHWAGEMEFARTLYRAGVRDFGVIKASRGGGGNSLWLKGSADDHMYAHVTNTVAAATADLIANGYSFEIVGLLYLQGESDNGTEAAAAGARLKTLTDNLRADLPNAAALYTVAAGITYAGTAQDDTTRANQAAIAASTSYIDYFDNTDLQADGLGPDGLHLNQSGKFVVGNRWAQAFLNAGIVDRDYGKLVFIGDSITQGGNGLPSYRYQVFKNLANANVTNGYTFVGSQTGAYQNNAGATPDVNGLTFINHHDGHYGWRAFWENARVALPGGRYNVSNLGQGTIENWTGQTTTFETADAGTLTYTGTTYAPDTAVIMIGINDIADGSSTTQLRDDIALMIDQLQAASSSINIFLSQTLHTDQGAARKAEVDTLNGLLPALALSKTTSSSSVWVIETNTGFDPSTQTHDQIHPNTSGEEYVGDRISGGLGLIEGVVVSVFSTASGVVKVEEKASDQLGCLRFEGTDIYNTGSYASGWSAYGELGPTAVGIDDLAISHPPGGGASWLEGTSSGWTDLNEGAWTLEARLKFDANPNGFILWLGTGTDLILVEIHANRTQDDGASFSVSHDNLDGNYHTFAVRHDPNANRYYVSRDGVLLNPGGTPYDSPNNETRMILGDYTSGTFGDGFHATIDEIKICRGYEGHEMHSGTGWINGWSSVGGISPSIVNTADLQITNTTAGGSWLEGTGTGWAAINAGYWTFETRLKFDANPNGFILWLGNGNDIAWIEIYANRTQDSGNNVFNVAHNNLDGAFHTFRVGHDPVAAVYHVWRDGVRLTPLDGAGYDSGIDSGQMILGDYTSGSFGNNFSAVIDYVRTDSGNVYLPPGTDADGDGMSDLFEDTYFGGLTNGVAGGHDDSDRLTNFEEYIADTSPLDGNSYFRMSAFSETVPAVWSITVPDTSPRRHYTLLAANDLGASNAWAAVAGQGPVPGNNSDLVFTDTTMVSTARFYQVEVALP